MAVEYDLIAIGSSPAGVYAAVTAAYLNARVALVEQRVQGISDPIYSRTLSQIARLAKQLENSPPLWANTQVCPYIEAMAWAQEILLTLAEQDSSAVLASLGVDVISGVGEFCRHPHLGFIVNNRCLRGRAYLLAMGSRPVILDINGLQETGYLTIAEIWQLEALPQQLVVIGGSPISVELAQSLVRLGRDVTLVVSDTQILPAEDSEASQLVQAQLEAEGVRVLTRSSATQVKRIQEKKWVQTGNQAIEADEIILAAQQEPNIEGLNLEGVGVRFQPQGIQLNEKLQTTNPCIYACGDVAGGYPFAHIAQYEAGIALKNALFLPIFQVDYRSIPWAVFTDPQLARVGMTEAQARRRYGKEVLVVRQYFKSIAQALVLGETTGFCKLVVRRNGEILGAHIVGPEAGELIGAIALAMKNKIKLGAIADLPHPSPTLSEILHKTATEWRRQHLSRNKTLKNFLESFFNLQRNWSK